MAGKIIEYILRHKVRSTAIFIFGVMLVIYWFSLPDELFGDVPCSTVVTDRNGELLGARIAEDGQWRFPPSDSIPKRFAEAVTLFEDRTFRWHPGVNPAAVARAAWQNIKSHRVVSGGSTITMQTIRLSRGREKRTLWQKFIEAVLATRLEIRCSKEEILAMYSSYAPFGGNVVGLEAAAWRYFGRPAHELSWAEAATLAVLPNAPAVIHPGRNRDALKDKRDRLLERLYRKGLMDSLTLALANDEPLPSSPIQMPQYAPHLTEWHCKHNKGKVTRTSLDIGLQKRAEQTVERWHKEFSRAGINDLAVVVIDIYTGEPVIYCGNAGYGSGRHGCDVDAVRAPRSTGSILKPFLYCAMLQEGEILPGTLLPDIPVNINGFSPQNFDRKFYGAVPADEALARSLNVPAVHSLRRYGPAKFLDLLKAAGMTTLRRPAADYGLSLILGGAEGALYEITSIYAEMAAVLTGSAGKNCEDFPLNDRMAVFCTFEALKEVNRPDEMDWRMISSVRKVAWKTGTSFGFRDGWAVGVTPGYAVGVWVGNAQGQGSPGLTGARTAGPVMFDIFNLLPPSGWFEMPGYGEYTEAEVCKKSGHLKGPYCDDCCTVMLPKAALRSAPCQYHIPSGAFVLPPAMEWFYREHHPEYRQEAAKYPAPATYSALSPGGPMEFIYPEKGSMIMLPRQLDGSKGDAVFHLAHSAPDATVFWHLDDSYIGSTRFIHQFRLHPSPGRHTCTVVDNTGNTLSIGFTIN